MKIIVLDAQPVGLVSNPNGKSPNVACSGWALSLIAAGHRVILPEIADYEIRRELLRLGRTSGLARLDSLRDVFYYAPLTTAVMHRAAEIWGDIRRRGLSTASPDALDCDVILAAQALLAGGPNDRVIVATGNVGHLGRFVDARIWDQIGP